ncbi:MAG: AMP-binding protein [Methylophilaceae bacterium]
MPTLPLLTHATLDQTMAWRQGAAITVQQFLGDVAHLAAMLPAGKHVLNICRDRYHFSVGLAAAMVTDKVSLLPPTHTSEMVRQLQAYSADVFCLHDSEDCETALPLLRYPAMPDAPVAPMAIPQIDSRQLVAIVFTSGSTSAPIPHAKTWGSLVKNVRAQAMRLGLEQGTRYTILGTVPPQHMYGFESTVLLPLQSGNALSSAQPFYPADIRSAIEAIPGPRVLASTPLHLRLLLEAGLAMPEAALVLSATAPLSTQLAQKIESSFHAPLLEIYGSTETGQIATRRTVQTPEWQLFPAVQLTQQGEHMWAAEGHIELPVALNDIIELTTDDRFLLHGRQQDLINIAGKRSSLSSLNHHLNAIAGMIDGAFYMPEETHDHVTRLCACVVAPGLSAQTIMTALRACMDPVFLPRPLLFVPALPRNSTGKLPGEALQKLVESHMAQNTA